MRWDDGWPIFDSDEEDEQTQIIDSVDKCQKCIELGMELEQVKADLKIHKDCLNSFRKSLIHLTRWINQIKKTYFYYMSVTSLIFRFPTSSSVSKRSYKPSSTSLSEVPQGVHSTCYSQPQLKI